MPETMTAKDAAAALGVSRPQLSYLSETGQILLQVNDGKALANTETVYRLWEAREAAKHRISYRRRWRQGQWETWARREAKKSPA